MRRASLQNIFHLSSQLGDHPDHLLEKGPAVPAVPLQLREDLSVPEDAPTRRQQLAVKASWVTIRMVAPLRLSTSSRSSSSLEDLESRAPVGSSGQHPGGPGDDGPGGGAALLLSAGHLIGVLLQQSPMPSSSAVSSSPVPDCGGPGSEDRQGQGNVFQRR